MTYKEAIDYLFNQTANYEHMGTAGYKPGLDGMRALDEHFGNPHTKFRAIHVGGTNGKGSVSHMLAALLQVCGYKVGLYTSPHLVDFRERIRVNGECIAEEYVVDFVKNEQDFFEKMKPSFFEITTVMAFKYFSECNVDIAVVEVGLGGRLDSTNIITPIFSIITNVSLDHTQLLGSSVEMIAKEKAGIMKPGVPCIIGETTLLTRPVFEAVGKETSSKVIFADEQPITTMIKPQAGDKGQRYKNIFGMELTCELRGPFQERNMNTVAHALVLLMDLGYLCNCHDPANVSNIVEEMNFAFNNVSKLTGLMGRWQTVHEHPTVVCDAGHNPGAWQYLTKMLEQAQQNSKTLRVVFGILEDKDVYSVMSKLPKKAVYYFTKPLTKRAFPEASVKVFGEQFGLNGKCYPTVEAAYKAALDHAESNDFIFVGGSCYVVADFLKTCV